MTTRVIEPRPVVLTTRTHIEVRRSVPHRDVRRVGAWIFVDHFGPTDQTDGMVVAAHPHTGLQTVTWMFEGLVEHRDSVGSVQLLRPGQVNLMTAGHGISHSEISRQTGGSLHAVQLWLALPSDDRDCAPFFEHHTALPTATINDTAITLFVGQAMGMTSPTTTFTDSFGAEMVVPASGSLHLSVDTRHEHGILVAEGSVVVDGVHASETQFVVVEPGKSEITLSTATGARLIFLGGSPFTEQIVMWWNFVGRSHAEIREAQIEWNAQSERFGEFTDDIGGRIPAPEIPNVALQPRP